MVAKESQARAAAAAAAAAAAVAAVMVVVEMAAVGSEEHKGSHMASHRRNYRPSLDRGEALHLHL